MRLPTAVVLVAVGGLAAWALPDSAGNDVPKSFLGLLSVGDKSLVERQGEYHLTVVTDQELARLLPTPEEADEHKRLSAERRELERAVADAKGTEKAAEEDARRRFGEWTAAHDARHVSLKLKTFVRVRTVVAVGDDYVGLRDEYGKVEFVPEQRIQRIVKNAYTGREAE